MAPALRVTLIMVFTLAWVLRRTYEGRVRPPLTFALFCPEQRVRLDVFFQVI